MSESVLTTALAFARHGHSVLPLHYPVGTDRLVCSCGRLCGRNAAKHPYGRLAPHGPLSATIDTGIIKHWFGYVVPEANLGVACDRLVVLDIDPRHDGDQSLTELEHECALPPTWRVLTGGGGEHILFAAPEGVSIKNYSHRPGSVLPLGPGIDIRAAGGYIVTVPSRHISGGQYQWSVDHHPQDVQLAPLPEWLAERLTVCRPGDDAGAEHEPISSDVWSQLTRHPVTEYRDDATCSIAGHFFRHNCDYTLVLGMMHAWNTSWCQPPLGFQELKNIVDRIARKEATKELAR
jgi:hypothetical protein